MAFCRVLLRESILADSVCVEHWPQIIDKSGFTADGRKQLTGSLPIPSENPNQLFDAEHVQCNFVSALFCSTVPQQHFKPDDLFEAGNFPDNRTNQYFLAIFYSFPAEKNIALGPGAIF